MDTSQPPWAKPYSVKMLDMLIVTILHWMATGISIIASFSAHMRDFDGPVVRPADDYLVMAVSKIMLMPLALPAMNLHSSRIGALLFPLNSFICAFLLLHAAALISGWRHRRRERGIA